MFARLILNDIVSTLILLGMLLVLAACAQGTQPPTPDQTEPAGSEPTLTHTGEIGGYGELIDALRGAGAQVDPAGEVRQEFFPVAGQLIKVNGVDVQVFEFGDEAAREAASALISADGSSIGTTMVTWVEPPHFWAKGRLIVLYVGSDQAVINLMTRALGDPIAG